MVATIPMKYFPGQMNWISGPPQARTASRSIMWASRCGLNPRFEVLNTLHPSAHVEAIRKERKAEPAATSSLWLGINNYIRLPPLLGLRAGPHVKTSPGRRKFSSANTRSSGWIAS